MDFTNPAFGYGKIAADGLPRAKCSSKMWSIRFADGLQRGQISLLLSPGPSGLWPQCAKCSPQVRPVAAVREVLTAGAARGRSARSAHRRCAHRRRGTVFADGLQRGQTKLLFAASPSGPWPQCAKCSPQVRPVAAVREVLTAGAACGRSARSAHRRCAHRRCGLPGEGRIRREKPVGGMRELNGISL